MATNIGNWGGGDVWRVTAGPFPSNTYICTGAHPEDCFLIDPGLDADAIDSELLALGIRPRYVFCTHGHFDHAGSASFFQEKYGARVFLHAADMKTLKGANFLLMAFKVPTRISLPELTLVDGSFNLDVGGWPLRLHHTPGHTEGSCVIELGNVLFTGDTIYSNGIGLSQLPGGDPDKLRASILSVWPKLTAAVTVCPGHGPASTGEAIKKNNKDLVEFLGSSTA